MRKRPHGYFTVYDNCLKEARKYSTLNELRKEDPSLYSCAYDYGFIDLIVKDVPLLRIFPKQDRVLNKDENIQRLQKIAKEKGGKCLSYDYVNTHTKMSFECAKKHIWSTTPHNIVKGRWCPECNVSFGQAYCKAMFETIFKKEFPTVRPKWLKGLELDGYCEELKIAFEYQGEQHYKWTPRFQTKKQFEDLIIRDRNKIKYCLNSGTNLIVVPTFGLKFPREDLEKFVFEELEKLKIYPVVKRPIEIDTVKIFNSDDNVNKLLKLKDIIKQRKGYLEDTVYKGASDHKYTVRCNFGHEFKMNGTSLNMGQWCPFCARNVKQTLEDCQRLAKEREGICLSKTYVNTVSIMEWQCSVGHTWKSTRSDVLSGRWCKKCYLLKLEMKRNKIAP